MAYPYYNYQQMIPQQQMMQQQPRIVCAPVASEEEAKGFATPFDGSTILLADLAHGRIYVKAPNYLNSNPPYGVFTQAVAEPPERYVTMTEFNKFKDEVLGRSQNNESNAVNQPNA